MGSHRLSPRFQNYTRLLPQIKSNNVKICCTRRRSAFLSISERCGLVHTGVLLGTMNESELDVLRRINFGTLSGEELVAIYHDYANSYRVHLNLIQHPRFPVKYSMGIVSKIFPPDLVRVAKNKRTNPFVRKKAELEFSNRYLKLALGEKLSLMKIAPLSLLEYFVAEQDSRILSVIFQNPYCTEELIIKFVNRPQSRITVYQALDTTFWHRRRPIAFAISRDPEAPIKMMLKIIPFLGIARLRDLYLDENVHRSVRDSIIEYMRSRQKHGY